MSGPTSGPTGHSGLSAEWYEEVSGKLEQGDVLFDFPLPTITFNSERGLGLARAKCDVIVVTQTCDIPKPAQTELLLAVVFEYSEICKSSDVFKSSAFRESLSKGLAISEFGLPPKPDGGNEFLVVSFRKLQVVPKDYVESERGSGGARLTSPYKEYFAQAYARFTMRVGLPLPLPKIK